MICDPHPMNSKEFDSSVDGLKNALGLLIRRIRAAAPSEQHELSWTQKSVIARLEKDGAMTSAELARAEGVKPQSMGTAITHLEDLGIIEKKAHPSDGRQLIIKLTTKGAAVRKTGKDASRAWLGQAIEKLDKKEQAILFDAGEIIKRLAEL
jgi:DNA-binding MarR family transcriptional regulator